MRIHSFHQGLLFSKVQITSSTLRLCSFFLFLLLAGSLIINKGKAAEDNFIRGITDDSQIGAQGVFYALSPVNNTQVCLSLHKNNFSLISKPVTKNSLFAFKRVSDQMTYYVCQPAIPSFGQGDYKWFFDTRNLPLNHFRIEIDEGHPRRSAFLKEANGDVVLRRFGNDEKDKIIVWTLHPDYIFDELEPTKTDSDSLLFKISQKHATVENRLSVQQVQDLYFLHYQRNRQKELTKVYEIPEQSLFFCHTPELPYVRGMYLTSGNFPLIVYNVGSFFKGIGDCASNALSKKQADPAIGILNIKKGAVLFLEPNYQSPTLPLLGSIEVTLGEKGYLYTSFDGIRLKLRDLIQQREQRGIRYSDFVVRYTSDTLSFVAINSWSNPGALGVITGEVGGRAAQDLEKTAKVVIGDFGVLTKDLSGAVIKLGDSIERSSENINKAAINISQALIKSSENFSDAGKFCVKNIGEVIAFSANSFNNAIRFLAVTARATAQETSESIHATVQEASGNITENTQTIIQGLERTTDLLSFTLGDAAKRLENSATNVSQSLVKSSGLFKEAFQEVSDAVKSGTKDISGALDKASGKFENGMKSIEVAAREMKNTRHTVKHTVCTIS